ncbi:MAG: Z1 domain-containing protein [Planctomycetota bacterium]
MSEENLKRLETATQALLAQESHPSPDRIRELIDGCRVAPPLSVDDDAAEKLARQFEQRHGVSMQIGSVLTEHDYEPWLPAAKSDINPYYWDRYRLLLTEKKFSGQVIATLDSVTDRILGLLENPQREGRWDRRGMVVGHVQSGKTANYTGLINKAVDAGYKLIIVIAGIHNNLRNQTQMRIDEGFVGRDSAIQKKSKDDRFIGVGRYDSSRQPSTFTNSLQDFSKDSAGVASGHPLKNLKEPAVFVIKKNSHTLKNLISYIKDHSSGRSSETVDAPMLLIDDEADNASINISYKKDEVSRINGQIRELLNLFERSCYVGYTATPFANIFIDPNSDDEMLGQDLFPKHFIVSLDPPSNYFGAERVFLDHPEKVIRPICDNEDRLPLKHKINHDVSSLPSSLMDAIRAFIVGRAIRLSRDHDGKHSSMLVNASRFTRIQTQLRNEIHDRLQRIQSSVRVNGAKPETEAVKDPEIEALKQLWKREYADCGVDWKELLPRMNEAAAPIKVIEVNSRSSDSLNYGDHEKSGLSVIAVGGLSLSRGLTLEGLMISYFLRNSMMYDTLMQMGRWFGYRPEYDDLCRVWMTEDAQGWYTHIAESIEELRDELKVMQRANATPEEFGLKVRSHPDTLIVTARNKFGSGEKFVLRIGLANKFVETHTLLTDEEALEHNRSRAVNLVDDLRAIGADVSKAERITAGHLLKAAPVEPVVKFLRQFRNHPASMLSDPEPICRHIEERANGELRHWDILFSSLSNPNSSTLKDSSLGFTVNCQKRARGNRSTDSASTLRIGSRQRVSSRGVEKTGLDAGQISRAEAMFRDEPGRADLPPDKINYPDRCYRRVRPRPLLIVHLIEITDDKDQRLDSLPVAAWSISFPMTGMEEKRVEYVVNTTWMRENFGDETEDDELEGADD